MDMVYEVMLFCQGDRALVDYWHAGLFRTEQGAINHVKERGLLRVPMNWSDSESGAVKDAIMDNPDAFAAVVERKVF